MDFYFRLAHCAVHLAWVHFNSVDKKCTWSFHGAHALSRSAEPETTTPTCSTSLTESSQAARTPTQDVDTAAAERESSIDRLVYELYGLEQAGNRG